MVTRLPESIQEEVRFLFIYMDDLLCNSNNFEDHLAHLQRIRRLRYADLVVNYKKCSFAAGEVELLGFLVGRHGIKVNPKKLVAVQKLPVPRTPRQVKSVLGLFSFYRRFISNFSTIAHPLSALTTAPVLAHFRQDRDIELHIDGSLVGIGAVLHQRDENNQLRVIAYASRVLNQHERNYSEIEALAVLFALNKFRQ
jgi:hypothetical protein